MEVLIANLRPAAHRLLETIEHYIHLPVHERSRPVIVVGCDKFEYGMYPSKASEGIVIPMPAMSAETLMPAMFAKGGVELLEEIQHSLIKLRSSKDPDKHIARAKKSLRKFTNLVEKSKRRDAILNGQRDGAAILPDLDDGMKVIELVVDSFERIRRHASEVFLASKMLVLTPDNGLRLTEPDIEVCRNTVKIAVPAGVTRAELVQLLVNSAAAACIVGTLRAGERRGIEIDQTRHPVLCEAVIAIESGLLEISKTGAAAAFPNGELTLN